MLNKFQSTLPARGATPLHNITSGVFADFNPRSPHGERQARRLFGKQTRAFQSTLPARGATNMGGEKICITGYFNPRSPHGERRLRSPGCKTGVKPFQSTLPARGATNPCAERPPFRQFQSTLPARGATLATAWSWKTTQYFNPRSPHGERPARHTARMKP